MKLRTIAIAASAVALGLSNAQAQSLDQLKEALSQANAAAAQATAAAKDAQAALQKVLAAQSQITAVNTSASGAISTGNTNVDGLTITNGANSATLYGLIDISYVNQNNANSAGKSVTTPRVAWFSGNRWGINGKRDLGDGMNAIFRLESEFESQTGNMDTPGTLFNRDSWLGLESSTLGKLTFGRQNALGRDPAASGVYGDPYGSPQASTEEGGYSNNNNFKQLVYYAGSPSGTRLNNGVVWKKKFDRFVAGAAYSFGGVVGDFGKGTNKTASLAYNGDGYTLAGFVNSANNNNKSQSTYSFGGNMALTPTIRVFAGYFDYKAEQTSALGDRHDTAYTISTKIVPQGSKVDYQLGYQSMRANNAGLTGSGYVQNAYADGSAITATATGNRNTVYASMFYHLDKATELYIAADKLTTTGGYKASQANGFMSQNELAVGMRYKF